MMESNMIISANLCYLYKLNSPDGYDSFIINSLLRNIKSTMGVLLARMGRYWDCFEEVEQYETETSKIKRFHQFKREDNKSEDISDYDLKDNQKDLDLFDMEKMKPVKAAAAPKISNFRNSNVALDSSLGNFSNAVNDSMDNIIVKDQAPSRIQGLNEPSLKPSKQQLLKQKLQRIRERRKQREHEQEKSHILNVVDNKEFFMDKEEMEEYEANAPVFE